jgi:hypothetical protein
VPTKSGLPGWFPEDFSADDRLLNALEQPPLPVHADKYLWQSGDIQLADDDGSDEKSSKTPETGQSKSKA